MVLNAAGGPVGAAPMGQAQDPTQLPPDIGLELNTYIYDYLCRKESYDVAKLFLTKHKIKQGERNKNGSMDFGKKDKRPLDLPEPDAPMSSSAEPFLETWWTCFFDFYFVLRNKSQTPLSKNYLVRFSSNSSIKKYSNSHRCNDENAQTTVYY
jgi:hypothetical protein